MSEFTVGDMIEQLNKVDPSTPILIRDRHLDCIKRLQKIFEIRLVKEDADGEEYVPCSLFDDESFKAVVIDDHGC